MPLDSRFRSRVYDAVRLIPRGRVATYGDVALWCGAVRQARQVGWALHTLPAHLVWGAEGDVRHSAGTLPRGGAGPADAAAEAAQGRVPWHRVVNAQGRVSTHPDEAGTWRQITLLRAEGIAVAADGTLEAGLAALRWEPRPDETSSLEVPPEVLYRLEREELAWALPASRRGGRAMPAWTRKDERQYDRIKESGEERGLPEPEAKEIAARTVNKRRREEGRTPNTRTQGTGNPNTPLAERSRDELYNQAKELGVAGRSRMSKSQLVQAIERAR